MTRPQEWSAYLEYDAEVPDDVHDRIIELLASHYAQPVTIPSTGNFGIHLTVEEDTAELAVASAVAIASAAMRNAHGPARLVAVELITPDEQERRNLDPTPALEGQLLGRAEIAHLLDVTPQRAGQIIETALFKQHARPVARLKSGPVYLASQVRAFKDAWPKTPGRPRKNA